MALLAGLQELIASGKQAVRLLLTNLVWLLACVAIVSVLVLTAAGFVLFGLYRYLILYLPLPATAFMVSVTALLLAALVAMLLKRQAGKLA